MVSRASGVKRQWLKARANRKKTWERGAHYTRPKSRGAAEAVDQEVSIEITKVVSHELH